MKRDNSCFTVTPPDMYLTEDGPTVLITSTDEIFVEQMKQLFESRIFTSIVFMVQPSITNENTVPWMWYSSQNVDYMVIDLDTCAWVDVCAGLLKPINEKSNVIFYNNKDKKRDVVRLINANGESVVLKSIEEIEKYLTIEVDGADG
jgi:hypothetical protein